MLEEDIVVISSDEEENDGKSEEKDEDRLPSFLNSSTTNMPATGSSSLCLKTEEKDMNIQNEDQDLKTALVISLLESDDVSEEEKRDKLLQLLDGSSVGFSGETKNLNSEKIPSATAEPIEMVEHDRVKKVTSTMYAKHIKLEGHMSFTAKKIKQENNVCCKQKCEKKEKTSVHRNRKFSREIPETVDIEDSDELPELDCMDKPVDKNLHQNENPPNLSKSLFLPHSGYTKSKKETKINTVLDAGNAMKRESKSGKLIKYSDSPLCNSSSNFQTFNNSSKERKSLKYPKLDLRDSSDAFSHKKCKDNHKKSQSTQQGKLIKFSSALHDEGSPNVISVVNDSASNRYNASKRKSPEKCLHIVKSKEVFVKKHNSVNRKDPLLPVRSISSKKKHKRHSIEKEKRGDLQKEYLKGIKSNTHKREIRRENNTPNKHCKPDLKRKLEDLFKDSLTSAIRQKKFKGLSKKCKENETMQCDYNHNKMKNKNNPNMGAENTVQVLSDSYANERHFSDILAPSTPVSNSKFSFDDQKRPDLGIQLKKAKIVDESRQANSSSVPSKSSAQDCANDVHFDKSYLSSGSIVTPRAVSEQSVKIPTSPKEGEKPPFTCESLLATTEMNILDIRSSMEATEPSQNENTSTSEPLVDENSQIQEKPSGKISDYLQLSDISDCDDDDAGQYSSVAKDDSCHSDSETDNGVGDLTSPASQASTPSVDSVIVHNIEKTGNCDVTAHEYNGSTSCHEMMELNENDCNLTSVALQELPNFKKYTPDSKPVRRKVKAQTKNSKIHEEPVSLSFKANCPTLGNREDSHIVCKPDVTGTDKFNIAFESMPLYPAMTQSSRSSDVVTDFDQSIYILIEGCLDEAKAIQRHCKKKEELEFVFGALELFQDFTNSGCKPSIEWIKVIICDILLLSRSKQLSFKAYGILNHILCHHQALHEVTSFWEILEEKILLIDFYTIVQSQNLLHILNCALSLKFVVNVLELELIHQSGKTRRNTIRRLLEVDSNFNNIRQVIGWIIAALSFQEYDELSLDSLNIEDSNNPTLLNTSEDNDYDSVTLCEIPKILPLLVKVLEMAVITSTSPLNLTMRICTELLNAYVGLTISQRKQLVSALPSLPKFYLSLLVLDRCYHMDTALLKETERLPSLVQVIEGMLLCRVETSDFDISSPSTSANSHGYAKIAPSSDEMIMLVANCVSSYLNIRKGKLHLPLPQRIQENLPSPLSEEDSTCLGVLVEYLSRCSNSQENMDIFMLGCLCCKDED